MRNNDTNKVLFVSLGCDKNLVDSEEMLGALQQRGFVFTDDEEEADAAIVNTCCFIMDAQKESIDQILALAQRMIHIASIRQKICKELRIVATIS